MKSHLFVVLMLIALMACNSAQPDFRPADSQVKPAGEVGFPTDVCRRLEGAWASYRIRPGADPRCRPENHGCGYAGPVHLKCEGGKVTGYVLLAYASSPPPGKAITAPVETNWADGKVILTHTDNLKCLYTYTAAFEGEKLKGTYEKRDCGGDERGEFQAEQ